MKRHIRILSVLLVICTVMTGINVYALDSNKVVKEEHTFTKAELACMTDGILGTATSLSEEFIKIKDIEGKTTRASTTYYIAEMVDGYMLTSSMSGTVSKTRYDATNYTDGSLNDDRMWIFTEDSNGDYIVYSYTDSTKCLTINPSTRNVTLSTYTGSEYQKWGMYYAGNGNALGVVSTDSRVSGYKLVIGDGSCWVSNTTHTPVGFFDVSWYIPVSALSHSNFYLALEQNKTVTPTKTPSNANCSNNWINWSSNNTSIFEVNDRGVATGVSAGTATLTFIDKITQKSGTCTITVMPIANGTYFLKNKENSNYAKVKAGTMTNGQNVVQYDYGDGNEFRWVFTLNTTTGYFSIKSANSSSPKYYMAVSDDSSALDKPIVIRSATETTLTDGMKWKVEPTSNGAYKIIPKTGETSNYVLATSTSLGTNNNNLIQGNYVDNNSYRDEWLLTRIQYTVNLDIVYDNAYSNRYSNAYSRINDQISTLQEKYLREFGITINSTTPSIFSSYADSNCTTSPTNECSHATNSLCRDSAINPDGSISLETYHHTNIYNIILRIPFPNIATSVKVAYIGHDYCTQSNHSGHPYYGLTSEYLGLATIMNFDSVKSETKTVIHEFGHLYGIIDHYGGSAMSTDQIIAETGNTGYNSNCIYGENKETSSVLSDYTICDGCKSIVNANIDRYDH